MLPCLLEMPFPSLFILQASKYHLLCKAFLFYQNSNWFPSPPLSSLCAYINYRNII